MNAASTVSGMNATTPGPSRADMKTVRFDRGGMTQRIDVHVHPPVQGEFQRLLDEIDIGPLYGELSQCDSGCAHCDSSLRFRSLQTRSYPKNTMADLASRKSPRQTWRPLHTPLRATRPLSFQPAPTDGLPRVREFPQPIIHAATESCFCVKSALSTGSTVFKCRARRLGVLLI